MSSIIPVRYSCVLKGQSSRTAEYVALCRALETQRPVERRVFADPLASAFLTGPLAAVAAVHCLGLRSGGGRGGRVVFGFDPGELAGYLADRGWELVDDLSTTEALTRHGLTPHRVPAFYRIALARLTSDPSKRTVT